MQREMRKQEPPKEMRKQEVLSTMRRVGPVTASQPILDPGTRLSLVSGHLTWASHWPPSYCQLFGCFLSQDADRWFLSSLIPISCCCRLSLTNCCQEKNRKIITWVLPASRGNINCTRFGDFSLLNLNVMPCL